MCHGSLFVKRVPGTTPLVIKHGQGRPGTCIPGIERKSVLQGRTRAAGVAGPGLDHAEGVLRIAVPGAQLHKAIILEKCFLPVPLPKMERAQIIPHQCLCLLYTSDAADERSSVDLGGRRIIKKKKRFTKFSTT